RSAVSRHRYQQRWIGAELHWRGGKKSSVGILYLYRPKRVSSPARGNDRRRIDQRETPRLEVPHPLTPALTAHLCGEGDWRRSNVPGKEYRDHRISTALVKQF